MSETETTDQRTSPSSDLRPALGHEDYALVRVPVERRYAWPSIAIQRVGQLSALSQFYLGGVLGTGMRVSEALLAITIALVIVGSVTVLVGAAGAREGLSTSVLARWAGFGRLGSIMVGLAISVSLTGWYAYQNELFGQGMHRVAPAVPVWAWCVVGGALVTAVVISGFRFMAAIAWVAVPVLVVLAAWNVSQALAGRPLGTLLESPPRGPAIGLGAGVTLVVGGFIVGAVMTPDMSRYNRSTGDVVKQTLLGVVLTHYVVGVVGVLLVHALGISRVEDATGVVAVLQSTVPVIAVAVLVSSLVKINDWNLYPSTLAVVNVIWATTSVLWSRAFVGFVLGAVGTALSALEITSTFTVFLTEVGVLFPPVAAIMIADYYLLRTWRGDLDASRREGMALPAACPEWVPAGIIAWVAGYAVGSPVLLGRWLDIGIPALNAMLCSFVVYLILGAPSLSQGVGLRSTDQRG